MKEKREIMSVLDKLIETLKRWSGRFQASRGRRERSEIEIPRLLRPALAVRHRTANGGPPDSARKDPDNNSSAAGALHRGWINLKSAVIGGDEHAILAECERGEDSAVEEFQEAVEDDLPPGLQEIVSRQYAEIKATHDRIRNLRDSAKG
jgi:uncharacterized protein (TIGR02284 family)